MAIEEIPEDATASPADGPWLAGNTQWYKPTWSETAALLGWRWVLCVPAVALVGLLVWRPGLTLPILVNGWKLVVFAVAIPLTVFGAAAKRSIRNRKDPFCIHCGYSLVGLPDGHRCPECGQPFTLALVDEYRRDPDFFIHRHRAIQTLPTADNLPFDAGSVRRKGRRRDGT